MKKFLCFLFVLIILGGAGFFFGWAQLTVPPGSYGVLRSKTHGVSPEVIREGEFRWVWYKLIPTNVEILVFSPRRMSRSLTVSDVLPSGGIYASLAAVEADFSWEISGDFSFALKVEALPALAEKQNLAGEGFRVLEDDYASRIEAYIRRRFAVYADDGAKLEAVLSSPSGISELSGEIETAFPDIENFDCLIRVIRRPDFGLYRSVKSLYGDYLSRQQMVLRGDVLREAETRINNRIRLDELAQYGELLTKYPILLDYLALERGSPQE